MPAKRKSKPRHQALQALPESFEPSRHDIMCAKGKGARDHAGNRQLRNLILDRLEDYKENPSKLERSFIVSSILRTVQKAGGRFIRQPEGGGWADIGRRNSKEKIGAMLRELLQAQHRSSAKAKASLRRVCIANDVVSSTGGVAGPEETETGLQKRLESFAESAEAICDTIPRDSCSSSAPPTAMPLDFNSLLHITFLSDPLEEALEDSPFSHQAHVCQEKLASAAQVASSESLLSIIEDGFGSQMQIEPTPLDLEPTPLDQIFLDQIFLDQLSPLPPNSMPQPPTLDSSPIQKPEQTSLSDEDIFKLWHQENLELLQ